MRFAPTVRIGPKPKFMNEFMDTHEKVCDASIQRGSVAQYLTYVVNEEIVFVLIKATTEDATENIPASLTWLDEHRHMLQLYSKEQGHTISETGFIYQESHKQFYL